jgi:P-type Cu2+ transporter
LVYAGTMNVSGALRVRVSTAAQGTLLDEVSRMLERALEARSQYVRLADRAARLYAPLVHAAAFATVVGWLAFGASWHDAIITGIAVLIITCPCALGLAIPAVQVVSSGALFRASVLLNSGEAIERLAGVDTILFDKTGTLTRPEPEVVNAADIPPDRLALAGRLALASRHPLAAAVARAAGAKAPLSAVEEPGQGVRCNHDGVELRLGRPSFCGARGDAQSIVGADPEASAIAFACGAENYVFAVRQKLRSDAADVIARLEREGFAVEILSGDRTSAVAHAARALGVDCWHAAVTPADKIAHIAALRAQGRNVLMVGDGLNDAPSLAAADASLSVATAAHLTQAAADAVFLGDRLAPVAGSRRDHAPRAAADARKSHTRGRLQRRRGADRDPGPGKPTGCCARHVGIVDPRHPQCIAGKARAPGAGGMEVLIYLVPIALALGLLGLGAFLWALKTGQYEDLEGAAWRVLMDDDAPAESGRANEGGTR